MTDENEHEHDNDTKLTISVRMGLMAHGCMDGKTDGQAGPS